MSVVGSFLYPGDMAFTDSEILMRKAGGEVKDSLSDFGMATGDIPWPADVTAKDPGVVDCPGQSGESSYFPDHAAIEAYDLEIEFKCRAYATRLYDLYSAFRDYLFGLGEEEGTEMEIYSPWQGIGRRCVRAVSMGDVEFRRDNAGEYASFKVTFRVCDPVTDIRLVSRLEGNTSLGGTWNFNV